MHNVTEVVTRPGDQEVWGGRRRADTLLEAPTSRRRPRRRPALPPGRAVIGAFLVTVAGVGVYAAYTGATTGPQGVAVVAARAIDPGERIDRDAIRVVRVDLPAKSAQNTYAEVAELEGGVALAPLAEGDLIQRSAVAPRPASSPSPSPQFSFTVERDRALNGDLRRGERVDVLATYGSGDSAYTSVVARGALVISVSDGDSATLASGTKIALTLELADSATVVRAAHATQVAAITLVRSTGVESDGGPDLYRPEAPSTARASSTTTTTVTPIR